MAYSATVVADSISEAGDRITTLAVTLPRIMLSEFNTHRTFSRNSASSRAIPVIKMIRAILDDTFIPEQFGINRPGMQAGAALVGELHDSAVRVVRRARDNAIRTALELMTSPEYIDEAWAIWADQTDFKEFALEVCQKMADGAPEILDRPDFLGVHKGTANRYLEPFMWHTIIVTATDWDNFFALRRHPDAQAEIHKAADLMYAAMASSTPLQLAEGEWHLPFLQPHEQEWAKAHPLKARRVTAARCARVSYLTHDTGIPDLGKDLLLAERLQSGGHMSPFEHAAMPLFTRTETGQLVSLRSGNLLGWQQYRKELPHEGNFALAA